MADDYVPLGDVLAYLHELAGVTLTAGFAHESSLVTALADEIERSFGPACPDACDCCKGEPGMDFEEVQGG